MQANALLPGISGLWHWSNKYNCINEMAIFFEIFNKWDSPRGNRSGIGIKTNNLISCSCAEMCIHDNKYMITCWCWPDYKAHSVICFINIIALQCFQWRLILISNNYFINWSLLISVQSCSDPEPYDWSHWQECKIIAIKYIWIKICVIHFCLPHFKRFTFSFPQCNICSVMPW